MSAVALLQPSNVEAHTEALEPQTLGYFIHGSHETDGVNGQTTVWKLYKTVFSVPEVGGGLGNLGNHFIRGTETTKRAEAYPASSEGFIPQTGQAVSSLEQMPNHVFLPFRLDHALSKLKETSGIHDIHIVDDRPIHELIFCDAIDLDQAKCRIDDLGALQTLRLGWSMPFIFDISPGEVGRFLAGSAASQRDLVLEKIREHLFRQTDNEKEIESIFAHLTLLNHVGSARILYPEARLAIPKQFTREEIDSDDASFLLLPRVTRAQFATFLAHSMGDTEDADAVDELVEWLPDREVASPIPDDPTNSHQTKDGFAYVNTNIDLPLDIGSTWLAMDNPSQPVKGVPEAVAQEYCNAYDVAGEQNFELMNNREENHLVELNRRARGDEELQDRFGNFTRADRFNRFTKTYPKGFHCIIRPS